MEEKSVLELSQQLRLPSNSKGLGSREILKIINFCLEVKMFFLIDGPIRNGQDIRPNFFYLKVKGFFFLLF